MNKQQLSTIALLFTTTSLVGFILGCEPADESVATTQPAEETEEAPISLGDATSSSTQKASPVLTACISGVRPSAVSWISTSAPDSSNT